MVNGLNFNMKMNGRDDMKEPDTKKTSAGILKDPLTEPSGPDRYRYTAGLRIFPFPVNEEEGSPPAVKINLRKPGLSSANHREQVSETSWQKIRKS
jgi:hypothetical protein